MKCRVFSVNDIITPVSVIYLDNNSTTRVAPEVVAAMLPFWSEQYGNPSSIHRIGQAARHAVEMAREQVASLINAKPRDIVFTSGGTEADNLAILGTLAAYPTKRHVITTSVEHVAVHSLCERLAKEGIRITWLDVDRQGHLSPDQLAAEICEDTALVSVMFANNETGVIFPIHEVAAICADRGIPLHVDAVQAIGKLPIDVNQLGAALLSMSAHKIHGPKGVGALYVGRKTRIRNQLVGGHQERDIRPGTENTAGIVGFGEAARLAAHRLNTDAWQRVAGLRDKLEQEIIENVPFARVVGDSSLRTPNTTSIAFESLEAEAILIALSERGVCASSGSACSSGSLQPSHVLKAMSIDERLAHGAVRFSLSAETSEDDVRCAGQIVREVVVKLSSLQTT